MSSDNSLQALGKGNAQQFANLPPKDFQNRIVGVLQGYAQVIGDLEHQQKNLQEANTQLNGKVVTLQTTVTDTQNRLQNTVQNLQNVQTEHAQTQQQLQQERQKTATLEQRTNTLATLTERIGSEPILGFLWKEFPTSQDLFAHMVQHPHLTSIEATLTELLRSQIPFLKFADQEHPFNMPTHEQINTYKKDHSCTSEDAIRALFKEEKRRLEKDWEDQNAPTEFPTHQEGPPFEEDGLPWDVGMGYSHNPYYGDSGNGGEIRHFNSD